MTCILFSFSLLIGCSGENEESTSVEDNQTSAATETTVDKKQAEGETEKEEKTTKKQLESDFSVTLLGTGHPHPRPDRFSASTLVEVGDEKLLFDAGRGAAIRLYESEVLPGEVNKLFLTHLHSDHVIGIDDVLLTGWLPYLGERAEPFSVWGPEGTNDMMSHLTKAFQPDIDARAGYTKSEGVKVVTEEIQEGVVFDENGIKVTAFHVDHEPEDSYGYRIDYKNRSLVLSGDTAYSENLIKYAEGADVIVHEVAVAPKEQLESSKELQTIMSIHTSPEEAGKIFSQTQPKLAVYSHIVLLGGYEEGDIDLVKETKATYSGDFVEGEDLMSIVIGEEDVEVQAPPLNE